MSIERARSIDMAMVCFRGEECPYRLVYEDQKGADGGPKQYSAQNVTTGLLGSGYTGAPLANQCSIAWDVMRKADNSRVLDRGPQRWHSHRAIEVMNAVYQIDKALGFDWRLYQVVAHALERLPRKYCHKECRGLPQLLPLFPPRPADGKFVMGAWYYHRRRDMHNFVVVQIVNGRTGRTGKEMVGVRALMDSPTAFGRRVIAAAYRSTNQDNYVAELVKGTCAKEPLSLVRVSYPFEKQVQRKAGGCKCCGSQEPHDQVVVGGSTVCAFHRVQRGGIGV